MCRFVLYMGPEITLDMLTTRPAHSLINQSFQSRLREEPLNGDGFGIAWYVPELSLEPALFRSIQPAWNNVNLRHLARVCRSQVILAHVRAATSGSGVSEVNCHPFIADRFAFMHNGSVAGFVKNKRRLMQQLTDETHATIQGTTDSEYLFARFRDHFATSDHSDDTQRMAAALTDTILETARLTAETETGDMPSHHSSLNLAVTDGISAVVSRFSSGDTDSPSLYTTIGTHCVCENGMCRMAACGDCQSAVLVASEPLNDDAGWNRVSHNQLLLIHPDASVETRPIVPEGNQTISPDLENADEESASERHLT